LNLVKLGERIRGLREKRGLKQSDLAHALQISAQAVSKWERGENAPDIAILPDLCRLLDVSIDWILGARESERDTFPATVFCSDLQGFAKKAASVPPRELALYANGVFHLITEAVLRHEGIPVKYVGDGFLAFFSGADHAERALKAARQAFVVLPGVGLDTMLHSGEVYLGSIGHRDYARPDILGETVNSTFLALGWLAQNHPGGLGLTENTLKQLKAKPAPRVSKKVSVKGLAEGLTVHVLDAKG